jgi:hypothetical protein
MHDTAVKEFKRRLSRRRRRSAAAAELASVVKPWSAHVVS